jgi:membrane protein YqaA with SNARE-associated domain
MDDSWIHKIGRALFVPPGNRDDGLNLRLWFLGFAGWLAALTIIARLGLTAYEADSRIGMAAWLLALYMFYLSLCCTFFPFPTTWIVMMMASSYVASEIGIHEHPVARMVVVASIGAFCTAMANLNEYHIFTFILRYGGVAKIRKTRLYTVTARWFGIRPFWTIVLFSFIPIPVDILRWLAITYRYPRLPFFFAYYLGRWVRYAGLAGVTIWGRFRWYHIAIVQGTLAVTALAKIIQQVLRQHRLGHLNAQEETHAEARHHEVSAAQATTGSRV